MASGEWPHWRLSTRGRACPHARSRSRGADHTSKPQFITTFHGRKGKLPHKEEPGAAYFVTMCLVRPAPLDLTVEPFGSLLAAALKHYDGSRYHLFDYTIMPDHVHLIAKPITVEGRTHLLARVLQDLKRWTTKQINRANGRRGELWQVEAFDHIIRNREDYEEKARYIFFNPHTAGLIDDPVAWPWWGKGSGVEL